MNGGILWKLPYILQNPTINQTKFKVVSPGTSLAEKVIVHQKLIAVHFKNIETGKRDLFFWPLYGFIDRTASEMTELIFFSNV